MKKLILMAMTLIAAISANAQDIQVHYDFGRNLYPDEEAGRQKVTVTVEQFKADQWGSWFYFVDIDFSRKFTEGAYTEISREFNLGNHPSLPILNTMAVSTVSEVSSRRLLSVPHGTDIQQTSPRPTPYNSCTSTTSRVTTTPVPMPAFS